ncbi:MAG TPA: glycosyltransferase family 4 protein [Sphingobium sp.]|uniref:glycosyltransferase family 4 protein n=1 Tax=Sphingobium sp. TaxID=1912891 RepID=UPI002ED02AC9
MSGRESGADPSFLCVHPHCELYGSDRTFLQSVRALKVRWPRAKITVLLTGKGPLYEAMREIVEDVRIDDMFVLRRSHFGPKLIFQLPRLASRIWKARRTMARYDVTYLNTVVVLDYMLASRLRRRPVLIHVHELPTGITAVVFSALLWLARAILIYISAATRNSYGWLKRKPAVIVWNGTQARAVLPRESAPGIVNLLLIGRFNAWKGQPLLLDALALLEPAERERLRVRLVGSVYAGQEHFKVAIEEKIAALDLSKTVELLGFDPNPDRYYAWADVVAVPSMEPEPFGLVAIEAMSASRAVIAADHGGLTEIVDDGVTGTLVTPGDATALRDAVRRYLADPALASTQGAAGLARFAAHFAEERYMAGIADAAQMVLDGALPSDLAAAPVSATSVA